MKIVDERIDETVIVRLEGRLDSSTAGDAQSRLDRLTDSGPTLLVVDLRQLDFMSSAGLRVLLSMAKKLRANGSVRLFGPNPSVREVFDVSGFSMIFPLFEDEPAAVAG